MLYKRNGKYILEIVLLNGCKSKKKHLKKLDIMERLISLKSTFCVEKQL